jgi:hypothetical protein
MNATLYVICFVVCLGRGFYGKLSGSGVIAKCKTLIDQYEIGDATNLNILVVAGTNIKRYSVSRCARK